MNTSKRKYLDYAGLQTYDDLLKLWAGKEIEEACEILDNSIKTYYSKNPVGSVDISNRALKLNTARKIELVGGVTGDGTFDGSTNVVLTTELHISGLLEGVSIDGNAGSATNFLNPKAINLIGDIVGFGNGGTDASGWNVSTTISDNSVTNSKLAGGITNDKLANDFITIGTTEIHLGQTINELDGIEVITAKAVIGNLTGTASNANRASADSEGNVINTTYATKAELSQAQSIFTFKGSVPTRADLPTNPNNGDVYNVEDEGKTYIWSSAEQSWSTFGSSYGPATADVFGLVKIGSGITNTNGTISLTDSNIDNVLGYEALKGVRVNGTLVPAVERIVDLTIPTEYATYQDIVDYVNHINVIAAIGYDPLKSVALNGTDLDIVNNRVNIDLSDYSTHEWTDEQIRKKISSLYKFKSSLQNYGELLKVQNPVIGDTYNIIEGNDPSTGHPDWPSFTSGTNFAWDGDEWDSLGGTLDLSSYYTKDETDGLLFVKADKDHNHDTSYYKKSEVDSKLARKAELDHHHDDKYYTKTTVDTLLLSKQDNLVSGRNIKTVEGNSLVGSGNVVIKTYHPFESNWPTGEKLDDFCKAVSDDPTAVVGMAYVGELYCSDFAAKGVPVRSGEATVRVCGENSSKSVVVEITNNTTAPYIWTYNYCNGGTEKVLADLNNSMLLTTTTGWSETASDEKVVSEALIRQVLIKLKEEAEQYVRDYFQNAIDQGNIDDIRSYTSYEYFPGNSLNPDAEPVSDVQFVDESTGSEYQWVWDDEETHVGHYMAINETTTKEDIDNLFK